MCQLTAEMVNKSLCCRKVKTLDSVPFYLMVGLILRVFRYSKVLMLQKAHVVYTTQIMISTHFPE